MGRGLLPTVFTRVRGECVSKGRPHLLRRIRATKHQEFFIVTGPLEVSNNELQEGTLLFVACFCS